MKNLFVMLSILSILSGMAAADQYLKPTCESIMTNDYSNLIVVDDLDSDGVANVLLGTSIQGNLHNFVYQGADCTVDWSPLKNGWTYSTTGDVMSIHVADLNKDGQNQVVINSVQSKRMTSRKPKEYVRVLTSNGLDDWNFNKECGFTHSVSSADLDNSGIENVILGCQSKKICALADDTKNKRINPVLWTYVAKNPVQHVIADDMNGDGVDEIIALDGKYGDAEVNILSNTGQKLQGIHLSGGFYLGANPWELIRTAKLGADATKSVIIGTSKGVVVWKIGQKQWEYNFQNPVSSILAEDLDGDGVVEVLVGSAPDIIAFTPSGKQKWKWSSSQARTIYSMSAYDIDGDGKKEVAVGAKGYIFILEEDGLDKGDWKYLVEIQGGDKNYSERDANAVSIYMGNLDSDRDAEVAAAWNWEEDTIRGNQYSTTLRVYEIDKNYVKPEKTELDAEMAAMSSMVPTTTHPAPTTTLKELGDDMDSGDSVGDDMGYDSLGDDNLGYGDEEDSGFCSCIPALTALLVMAVSVLAKLPFFIRNE